MSLRSWLDRLTTGEFRLACHPDRLKLRKFGDMNLAQACMVIVCGFVTGQSFFGRSDGYC